MIPKKEEYYNKKYQAVIEVKSKKNDLKEVFVLACQLKIYFTTVSGEKEGQEESRGQGSQKAEKCKGCGQDLVTLWGKINER